MIDVWNKAVLYHFVHAIALLVLRLMRHPIAAPAGCFLPGIILFSGSSYSMALIPHAGWFGADHSLGGLCFLGRLGLAGYRFGEIECPRSLSAAIRRCGFARHSKLFRHCPF